MQSARARIKAGRHLAHQLGWIVALAAGFTAASIPTVSHAAASVESFSPRGTVKGVRQVTARFSAPMVRFGEPGLPNPFHVDCPAAGHGRWADSRNWVFDFSADLGAGVRCRFSLDPSARTLTGDKIDGPGTFEFNTGGPAIVASLPRSGQDDIDERQVFLLRLDAPVAPQTVTAHTFCSINGLSEKIPVELLGGSGRAQVLAQRKLLGYEYYQLLWKNGEESVVQAKGHSLAGQEALIVTLRCARSLPPGTAVQLVWGAGIASISGIASTEDQTLAFKSRAAFTANLTCQRASLHAGCLPMTPITVTFTAPVVREVAEAIRLHGHWHSYKPKLEDGKTVEALNFEAPFPPQSKLQLELPAGFTDDGNRKLENAGRFPLEVAIDEAPPLVKFPSQFGVLEQNEGGVLPVTLRNVEGEIPARKYIAANDVIGARAKKVDDDAAILRWMARVETAMKSDGQWDEGTKIWTEKTGAHSVFEGESGGTSFSVPKPHGPQPFEVVGIPLKEPGFYVVELASPKLGATLLGDRRIRYVATTALVTNMAVHFKAGLESSLVFVSRLDSAEPVADAAIRVDDGCTGAQLWNGRTDGQGIARINQSLPERGDSCDSGAHPLMVSARSGDDLSFTLSTWNRGISSMEFHLPVDAWQNPGPLIAHTVLDRTLFRAGETVSMKHFLRATAGSGFKLPTRFPKKMVLHHQASDQSFELPLKWSADATAESRWVIPRDAKLGVYDLQMPMAEGQPTLLPGTFRVEQYKVPSMRAILQGPKDPLINKREAPLDLFVSYLSGGGAGNLPVKLRTQVRPRLIAFPDYPDFHFGGAEVKEGIDTGGGNGAIEDDEADNDSDSSDNDSSGGPVQVLPLMLDAQGAAHARVGKLAPSPSAQDLVTEAEYQDANGETLTTSLRLPLWPSAVILGLQPDGWIETKDDLRFKVLALDLHGKPMAGRDVTVDAFQRITRGYRRRLVGGFYAYDHSTETRHLRQLCQGRTDQHGLLICATSVHQSGELILQAVARDNAGNRAVTSSEMWVAAGDDWWFDAAPSDRMDVLPEQTSYEPGQTARFQVRMPFRSATALVTVEREGVLSSFVTHLSGKSPVVEIPITDAYSPNVYVSVLAVRGRIGIWHSRLADLVRWLHLPLRMEGGTPTALVDLSKPAYRLGIGHINVGWAPHRLDVKVTSSADVYKVRGTAKVAIDVRSSGARPLPPGAEVAVAAVDEGLLELKANDSWKLLDAMMEPRSLQVETSTVQMQVIGKRHYGRKSGAPGGGGGRGPTRELFDTLLLWRARVPLDANGHAQLEIPLNDSLSSFRIVAVADAGVGWFGTGATTIRTSQDLQLLTALPSLVREGDRFNAVITVRNASARPLTVEVKAHLTATPRSIDVPALPAQTVHVAANSASEVSWPLQVPEGLTGLAWDVAAHDPAAADSDRLKISQSVLAAYPVETYQATLSQVEAPISVPVERPAQAIAGRGGIRVELRAQLGEGGAGVREYMGRYPYTCIEQRVSKAIALGDAALWRQAMELLPAYMDHDALLKYFAASDMEGSDALTAYVLAIAQEAGWEIPETAQDKLLGALQEFVAGRLTRESTITTADLTARKLAAIDALARYGKATPAMVTAIAIDPNLWPTSAVLDWIDILHRLPTVPAHDEHLADALQILRARLNFQGTSMTFSTEQTDALWWLMLSADSNAARVVLETLKEPTWHEDAPRLARALLGRQQRGHWNTTLANAWGTLAMQKFSTEFEHEPVTGRTQLSLGSHEATVKWGSSPPAIQDFPWPSAAQTLQITHQGAGRPWATIASLASIPLQEPMSSGYTLHRSLIPVQQKKSGSWSRGDVARVHLDLEAQSDMTWVVVNDPLPAGAVVQGSGLGGDSALLTREERRRGAAWLAWDERRAEAYRSYYAFVPKGKWTMEYTVRFNTAGTFQLPPSRVEAMYAPEMFGATPSPELTVNAP